MKITRIELCHPVNRPGKHDDNFKELPGKTGARLEQSETIYGVVCHFAEGSTLIPISNIRSIDYEETKKK